MMQTGYIDPAVVNPAYAPIAGLGALSALDAWKILNFSKQVAMNAEARRDGGPIPFPRVPGSWQQMQTGQPPAGLTVDAMQSAAKTWQQRAAAANQQRKAREAARPAPVAQVVEVRRVEASEAPVAVAVQRGSSMVVSRPWEIGYSDPKVLGLEGLAGVGLGSWLSSIFHQVTGVNLSTVTAAAANQLLPGSGALLNPGPQQSPPPPPPPPPAPSSSNTALLAVAALGAVLLIGGRR